MCIACCLYTTVRGSSYVSIKADMRVEKHTKADKVMLNEVAADSIPHVSIYLYINTHRERDA